MTLSLAGRTLTPRIRRRPLTGASSTGAVELDWGYPGVWVDRFHLVGATLAVTWDGHSQTDTASYADGEAAQLGFVVTTPTVAPSVLHCRSGCPQRAQWQSAG